MSIVTTVVLIHAEFPLNKEVQLAEHLSRFDGMSIWDRNHPHEWPDMGQHAGGTKVPECRVLLAAFNHFNVGDFFLHLNQFDWSYPDEVMCVCHTGAPLDHVYYLSLADVRRKKRE